LRRRVEHLLRRLKRDERGAGAVEFALLVPVLALVTAGLVDTSRLIVQSMQLKAAAQAGADYALRSGWDEAKVERAATAASPAIATTATAAATKGCIAGGTINDTTAATCPGGATAGTFVRVSAQAAYRPLFPNLPLLGERTLSAQARVRIP
jgi:Flp pilus assembly protein TadG